MDISGFHRKLAKGSDFPFLMRLLLLTFSSWLFQGILYMDTTERNFKCFIDFIIFLPLFFIFNRFLPILSSIVIAIMIAHTFNWVINGQIYVLLKNLNLLETSTESFIGYMSYIKKVENEDSIVAAAAFGSLSRENLRNTSDLDVRIIRKQGIMNGISACFFVLKERTRSFFNGFPLDIYVLDSCDVLYKHINDEKPIVIYDPYKVFEKN